ncbi:MAG: hypothetical protein K9N40_04660 [Candidatus Cloacimonetes bacterium]|nr:hypothetical protein [Candidatus Cloacimonadota bacterium]
MTNNYVIPLSWSLYDHELSPGAADRFAYYQAAVYPTGIIGGTHVYEGWDCCNVYFQQAYDDIVVLESDFDINLDFEHIRPEDFTVTAEVNLENSLPTTTNKIFFVITNWKEYSEENPWYYLVVAKSDEQDVTIFNSGETAVYTAQLSVDMQPDWNLEDLHAVAIIQNWNNREILQAAQTPYQTVAAAEILTAAVSNLSNFPNPFNPTTTISYDLSQDTKVELNIYNSKGQLIKSLVDAEQSAGYHQVIWNGTDNYGNQVSSGIYFSRFSEVAPEGGRYTSVKKMVMLK